MDLPPRNGTLGKVRGLSEMGVQTSIFREEKPTGSFFSGESLGSARAGVGCGSGDLCLECAAFANPSLSCWKGKLVAAGGGWELHRTIWYTHSLKINQC